jgi:thymidylate kinase
MMSISRNRGLIIELVGPAGSGKTTIFRALEKKVPGIIGEVAPPVWERSNIKFYAKNVLRLVPILLRLQRNGPKFISRRELAFMCLLNGWHFTLEEKMVNTHKTILLDQGPVFIMAYLSMVGQINLENSSLCGWWKNVFTQWAETINTIIYLDTSIDTLISRIRNRQDHVIEHVNGKTDEEAQDFLERYGRLYDQIISRLSTNNDRMRVIRIDSGKNTIDEIVNTVIFEIES